MRHKRLDSCLRTRTVDAVHLADMISHDKLQLLLEHHHVQIDTVVKAAHLMRDALRGHQRSSEVIRHVWVKGAAAHLMRDALGGTQRHSEALRGTLRHSTALSALYYSECLYEISARLS